MKILLSKLHIDENSYYNIFINTNKPEDTLDQNVVFSGTLEGLKDFFGISNIIKPTSTAISNIVSNDNSHITKLFEKKSKIPNILRTTTPHSFPIMYRDYREEGLFSFSNDSVGSLESAWQAINSPDSFVIYSVLVNRS